MKTSKIISTFAVLFFIVATVTASTSGEIIKTLKSKSLSHITTGSSLVRLSESYNQSLLLENVSESMIHNDYSYLKFNVSDYSRDGVTNVKENIASDNNENSYNYLKFDVTGYENAGSDFNETMELPNLDIEYLKFDVNNFIDANEINPDQISELPVNEFNYLKFDINKYSASISFTPDFGEMPSNK